jgi:hypothetical protein
MIGPARAKALPAASLTASSGGNLADLSVIPAN